MRIFQPMLFVGLGGTGGLIGAELERRLRAELCGPDGTALAGGGRLRHQLPGCLQFVYADYSESELARLPHLSAERALRQAYGHTARATHDLLPTDYDSSPDLTRMLRAVLRDEVAGWLPPHQNEPKVFPLHNGAGQLPTVGRAALFGTLRNGPAPVAEPLRKAIDIISRSGSELEELEGGPLRGCDVFVAFSVAGGTGAGIFLDYLHLIGQVFHEMNFTGARIYPLVVMPSAFPEERGGGRAAELNAASAVVDLFRLVDEQNVPDADADLGESDTLGALRIRYPEMHPVRLRHGMVPTAFLFNRTAGVRPEDLRRSIVSLVMSLVGTELGEGPGHADDDYQTFAANFINRGIVRRTRAATGIGHRGVSTSLVASMTAPLDELAELVSARMLAEAVPRLLDRKLPRSTETAPLVQRMFTASGLAELWRREAIEVPEPVPVPRGGPDTERALRDRIDTMQRLLADLERRVARRMPELVEAFAPRSAAEQLVQQGELDIFRLEAVIRGVPEDRHPVAARGFLGMLENRRQEPARPDGVALQPPAVPRIRNRLAGLSRPHWGDDEVLAAVEEQNRWYHWRAHVIWHQAWNAQEPRWRPAANDLRTDMGGLADAFRLSVEEEAGSYAARKRELYEDRTGVSYFLPPQPSLPDFIEDLKERLVESEGLRANDQEDALLLRLVDADRWKAALVGGRRNPQSAVAMIKGVLKHRVHTLFAEGGRDQRSRPLMPSLGTLLSAAAGDPASAEQVSDGALRQFGFKLAGLLPAGFTPEGTGPLKILITYPKAHSREAAENYLKKAIHLPSGGKRTIECRGVDTESITVVLFRSEMSLTEVPEARNVLRQWARSQDDQRAGDLLRWRQRLGYQDDWLASTGEDRKHILHRLLCAMWNGQIDCQGDIESPVKVRIRLHDQIGPHVPGMTLRLDDYRDEVSSWAGLLRSYERWALLDESAGDGAIVEDYCRQLMGILPHGLAASGSEPSPLYVKFVNEIAPRQLRLLDERERRYVDRMADWARPLRQFWEETLDGALDLPFPESKKNVQPTLRTLEEWVREPRGPGRESAAAPFPPRQPVRDDPARQAYEGQGRPAAPPAPPGPGPWTPPPGWQPGPYPDPPHQDPRRDVPQDAPPAGPPAQRPAAAEPPYPGEEPRRQPSPGEAPPPRRHSWTKDPEPEGAPWPAEDPYATPASGTGARPGPAADPRQWPGESDGAGAPSEDPGAPAAPRAGRVPRQPYAPPAAPTAGRAAAGAAATAPMGAGGTLPPPYPDEQLADEGWPGDDSSVPWGLADSDGQTDWDGGDESRGEWDGDPE